MEMMTAAQAAEKWNVALRTVQNMCRNGRIAGAQRVGRDWLLPKDAVPPVDRRRKEAKAGLPEGPAMPRRSPMLCVTDLYQIPGSAARVSRFLKNNPEARALFDAGIAYSRGELDRVYEYACSILEKGTGFYAVAGAGLLLSFCAIWRGDMELWQNARHHIFSVPCPTAADREVLALIATAADSSVFDYTNYPDWFEQGNFEILHPDTHPMAKIFYAKYLYMIAYAVAAGVLTVEGVQGLALMSMIGNTLEPLITQAVVDKTVIPEIHLRLWCATVYHNSGKNDMAVRHIDKAIKLALPDRLYGILAEHWRQLDQLLEKRLALVDAEAMKATKELYNRFLAGQSQLGGILRNRHIATNLTAREREVAKLVSFRFSNKQIAQILGISESTVKTNVQNIMAKTGLKDRTGFASIL